VIAHYEEAEHCEKKGEDERTKKALLSQERKSPIVRAVAKILEYGKNLRQGNCVNTSNEKP